MSSSAGWYPDPGGEPGSFRYWDGRVWSAQLTRDPRTPAPGTDPTPVTRATETLQIGPARRAPRPRPEHVQPPRRLPPAWVLGLVGVGLVVVLIVVLVVRFGARGLEITDPGPDPTSTRELCPPPAPAPSTTDTGARVVSGPLSYPRIGAPFSAPTGDDRIPYGREIRSQVAEVERRPDGRLSWVAQIVIAQLTVGDGFYAPQEGAAVIANCVTGLFYGGAAVTRVDRRNEAITVSGRPGWIIEAHLTFDVPEIRTKGETMIIIVVETPDGAGLFYGSLPDTSPGLNAQIRQALAGFQVG